MPAAIKIKQTYPAAADYITVGTGDLLSQMEAQNVEIWQARPDKASVLSGEVIYTSTSDGDNPRLNQVNAARRPQILANPDRWYFDRTNNEGFAATAYVPNFNLLHSYVCVFTPTEVPPVASVLMGTTESGTIRDQLSIWNEGGAAIARYTVGSLGFAKIACPTSGRHVLISTWDPSDLKVRISLDYVEGSIGTGVANTSSSAPVFTVGCQNTAGQTGFLGSIEEVQNWPNVGLLLPSGAANLALLKRLLKAVYNIKY